MKKWVVNYNLIIACDAVIESKTKEAAQKKLEEVIGNSIEVTDIYENRS